MADLDPNVIEMIARLGVVSETAAAAVAASSKSQEKSWTSQRLANDQLSKSLQNFYNISKDLADQRVKEIQDTDKANADKIKSNEKIKEVTAKVVGGLSEFAKGALGTVSAIGDSNEAFSSVKPVVQLLGTTVKTVTSAMASLGSGIPVIGMFLNVAEKVTGVVTDLTVQAMQIRLDNAQRMVNQYAQIAKAGAVFGGSITEMQVQAAAAGFSVDSFSKMIMASAGQLAKMNGSISENAGSVAKMSRSIRESDSALFAMYGSNIPEFASALANYGALMAGYGMDITKNQTNMNKSAADYLRMQKDLQEVTGISLDQQKKESDERMSNIAYQDAMARIGSEGVAASEKVQGAASGLINNKAFSRLLQETITNNQNGAIISPEAQETYAMLSSGNRALLKSLSEIPKQGISMDEVNAGLKAAFTQAAKESGMNGLPNNPLTNMGNLQNTLPAGVIANMSIINALFRIMGKDFDFGKATDSDKSGKGSVDYAALVAKLEKLKMAVDKETIAQFKNTIAAAEGLNKLQKEFLEKFSDFNRAFENVKDAIEKLVNQLTDSDNTTSGSGPSVSNRQKYFQGQGLSTSDAKDAADNENFRSEMIPGYTEGTASANAKIYKDLPANYGLTNAPSIPNLAGVGIVNEPKGGKSLTPEQIQFQTSTGLISSAAAYGENGGRYQVTTQRIKDTIAEIAKRGFVGSVNSTYRDGSSGHSEGRAFDFSLPSNMLLPNQSLDTVKWANNMKPNEAIAAKWANRPSLVTSNGVTDLLRNMGFTNSINEYENPSSGATGPHIHAELPKMASGGVTDGTSIAGEAGPEAVIPLPDGRRVPVKLDMGAMNDKFDEMISVLKENRDYTERLVQVSA